MAHTVPDIAARHGAALQLLDRLCVLVFAVEYLARIWVAPEHPLLHRYTPAGARLRFAATPMMVIDALALLPLLLELLFPRNELMLLTRLVRFLKLARYSPALATLGRLIASERRALLACVIIFTGILLAAAAAMHVVEGAVQPDKLGDMPKAIWWAASMLAKIGGGELAPLTTLGPHHRRDHGDAGDRLLRAARRHHRPRLLRGDPPPRLRGDVRHGRARAAVRAPRRGRDRRSRRHAARAHRACRHDHHPQGRARATPCTSSPAAGSRWNWPTTRWCSQEGDFFGEIALLSREPRSATVTALRPTDLLVLDADDFLRLVDRLPDIGAKVQAVAKERRLTPPQAGRSLAGSAAQPRSSSVGASCDRPFDHGGETDDNRQLGHASGGLRPRAGSMPGKRITCEETASY